MVRKVSLKSTAGIVAAAAIGAAPMFLVEPARATEDDAVSICTAVTSLSMDVYNAGNYQGAKLFKPILERCLVVLKARELQAAQDAVDRFYGRQPARQ